MPEQPEIRAKEPSEEKTQEKGYFPASLKKNDFSRKICSFEIPPDPIPRRQIKKIVTTDIVVAGAGLSGLAAALSAAEKGSKVVLLEKDYQSSSHGFYANFIGSKLQKQRGIEIDKQDVIQKLFEASEGRADLRLIRKWMETNGQVADWLIDMANANGIAVNLNDSWSVHTFGKNVQEEEMALLQMLTQEALHKGVDIKYSTPAVCLISSKMHGRVTGIIAQKKEGDYVQFNASKSVILCTGDYGNNNEMLDKYCPWALPIPKMLLETATGDGLKMAMWIGAAIQDAPHCVVIHFNSTNELPLSHNRPLKGRGNFLYVNKLGERFTNEGFAMERLANIVLRQPHRTWWQVFDAKSVNDENRMGIYKSIEKGAVLCADTIEELALKFGANSKIFKASVDRYNEMMHLRKDLDFGKDPRMLINTIDSPPFYVCESPPNLLAAMGGLILNIHGQVLDKQLNVIPGLYAAGNLSGGFWGDSYPMNILSGIARSHALTFGRIAGLHAANQQSSQGE